MLVLQPCAAVSYNAEKLCFPRVPRVVGVFTNNYYQAESIAGRLREGLQWKARSAWFVCGCRTCPVLLVFSPTTIISA